MTHRTLFAATLCASAVFALHYTDAAAAPGGQALLLDSTSAAPATLPARAASGPAAEGRFNGAAFGASRVHLPLPDGRVLGAERRKEIRGNRGERTWIGEFDGQPGSLLTVTEYRGVLEGFLHHGTEVWELASAGPGRVRLYRVDESKLPDEGRPVPVAIRADAVGTTADATADALVPTAAEPATQDLLVVYTPAVAAANGGPAGIETKILNAVAAANQGYVNSQVGIRLNVVGLAQTDYVETGDMGTSLSRVSGTGDGYMDEVHALRDRTGADLVALITNESNYCGIAYVMSYPSSGFAPSAFSVTQPGCFSNQTLAHEIGHNQGNAHDRVSGGSGAYPYSYGYRTCDAIAPTAGQSFRTIMGYPCGSAPRVNYFSNPNVYWNGAPMGVDYALDPARAADNARSMNQTAAVTAAFRSPPASAPPAAPGSLVATAPAFDRVELRWADQSGDETGFVVQRATGGGSYVDRATLGANVTAFTDTALSGGTTYSYRVRAYNSAGSSGYSNAVTLVTPAPPPPPVAPTPAAVTVVGTSATVAWTDVANESGYDVRRETLNTRKGTWSATVTGVAANTTSTVQSLSAGTYRYAVRAVGAAGVSGWVVAGCATCAADGSFTIASAPKTTARGRDKP